MKHIPYGYNIVGGMAVIDEDKALKVKKFFGNYLAGLSLASAAADAGIQTYHGSAGRMLRNKRYLGDDYYPAIVDAEIFEAVEKERIRRAVQLGRVWDEKSEERREVAMEFQMNKIVKKYRDPFEQAEYVYSLIKEGSVGDDNS